MNASSKYFLYARKSTDEASRQLLSIEAQLFELREMAKRERIEIVQEFIESKTAKQPGRPVFNEMISLIEAGKSAAASSPPRLRKTTTISVAPNAKAVALRNMSGEIVNAQLAKALMPVSLAPEIADWMTAELRREAEDSRKAEDTVLLENQTALAQREIKLDTLLASCSTKQSLKTNTKPRRNDFSKRK